jgi:hypothetical protein
MTVISAIITVSIGVSMFNLLPKGAKFYDELRKCRLLLVELR